MIVQIALKSISWRMRVSSGLCANTCPEQAITLKAQLSFGPQTLEQSSLHGEDPFECIECGRPFGVKSTIECIIEKLEGNHWMYTDSDNTKLVKMCDDCRISAQYTMPTHLCAVPIVQESGRPMITSIARLNSPVYPDQAASTSAQTRQCR